ncbi:MAG: DRTGG domain-containing protein [Desulfobacteraceae bacterium]
MIVKELADRLELEIHAGKESIDREILCGYTGDLLSDVMARIRPGAAWLTIQTHQNIVAVAVLREAACIIITGGHVPDKETLERAEKEDMPVLLAKENSFDLCAKIAELGIF